MNLYDFDGTIYNGDSTIDFFLFILKKRPTLIRFLPKQILGFLLYGLKIIDKTQLKNYFFCFVSAIDTKEMVKVFWNKKSHNIFEWYHRQKREDDIIISASPEFLLKPICVELGVSCLIASKVDIDTGILQQENCWGEMKLKRLMELYDITCIDNFYSDSYSDLPLAMIAKKAFLIKKGDISEWKTPNSD